MRTVLGVIAVLAAAACGSSTKAGLYVQLSGSAAGQVASIEVIAAGSAIIEPQRTSDVPGMTGSAVGIPYYVQLDTTGPIADPAGGAIDLATYTVLVEPDPSLALDQMVPIVLARDATNQIVAVGVFDSGATPAYAGAVTMDPAIAEQVAIEMSPVIASASQIDDSRQTQPNTLRTFSCAAPHAASGHVWLDNTGRELRVLLPTDGTTSAKSRDLDIDCDGSGVDVDCDDTAADIYPGAPQSCNDVDSACRNLGEVAVLPCVPDATGCAAAAGREICDEAARTSGTCAAPNCGDPTQFDTCTVAFTKAGGPGETMCTPAVGPIVLPPGCASGCTLHVDGATNGLVAQLATSASGPFGANATTDGTITIYIQVDAVASVGAGASLGIVDLIVTPTGSTNAPEYHGIVMQANDEEECGNIGTPNIVCIPAPQPQG